MKELIVQATDEALIEVQEFIEAAMEVAGFSMKATMQVSVCVEELYVNIAHYAYYPEVGSATIRHHIQESPREITIQFEDGGVAFDPLTKEDADITLSAEERGIGGLGILMVKRTMDQVKYERIDGKNILTICKSDPD